MTFNLGNWQKLKLTFGQLCPKVNFCLQNWPLSDNSQTADCCQRIFLSLISKQRMWRLRQMWRVKEGGVFVLIDKSITFGIAWNLGHKVISPPLRLCPWSHFLDDSASALRLFSWDLQTLGGNVGYSDPALRLSFLSFISPGTSATFDITWITG